MTEHIEYYESLNRKPLLRRRWYWRWVAGNNEIIAVGGESYVSESNVKRAIQDNVTSKMSNPIPVVRRGN